MFNIVECTYVKSGKAKVLRNFFQCLSDVCHCKIFYYIFKCMSVFLNIQKSIK